MKRWDLINYLVEKYNYKDYLEIGTRDLKNFEKINIPNKTGVDPDPVKNHERLYKITSDDFFKQNKNYYHLIFIDGLHEKKQVEKDILNSLNCLNENGIIVCHDMNPPEKINQIVPQQTTYWNGNCWKAFANLRRDRSDLIMYVVNTDWGLGLIQKGEQKTIDYPKNIEWDFEKHLEKDRKNILNLISIEEFKKIY